MDAYDLLPVNNYKFGRHKDIDNVSSDAYKKLFTQGMADGCWYGCSLACAKAVDHFPLQTGPWKGREVIVDGPEYETAAGLGSNLGVFDPLLDDRGQLLRRPLRARYDLARHRPRLRLRVLRARPHQ